MLEKVSGLCPAQAVCVESVQLGPVVGRRQQLRLQALQPRKGLNE